RQPVAHVDERRLATEAEHVDVVAEIVGPAVAEESRRLGGSRQRAGERARLALANAGAEARLVVGATPGAIGIDRVQHLVDDGALWPFVRLATTAAGFAIGATHG